MSELAETEKPRRAGRRTKAAADGEPRSVTREEIINHALKIAQKEQVDAITIMRLSREMDVTPALIHYFTGGRDKLLSAVMNHAMAADGPRVQSTGKWLTDLEALTRDALRFQTKWKGITTYQQSHNKHRLFQDEDPEINDQGLAFFDRVGRILQSSGMTPERAAMAYHLLMLFMTSVANNHVNKQQPASHRHFLKGRHQQLDAKMHPGADFMLDAFSEITTESTFETGLQVLLATIDAWAPATKNKPVRKTSRPALPKV
jgi:AcrR family transcriptional regulator